MTDIVDELRARALLGMSGEREAKHLAQIAALEKERDALLAKIETAENDAAHQKALAASALRVAEGWERKCGELRAKIEAMEQQEPARLVTPTAYRWRYRGAVKWQYGELTEEVARLAKEHNHEVQALGILPGAQNVPTALLVAVADLIAQMEIVSRVGFVDTPDDKDSCAAFCVAEGSWLELMSAVESLASALAAAPEAKP